MRVYKVSLFSVFSFFSLIVLMDGSRSQKWARRRLKTTNRQHEVSCFLWYSNPESCTGLSWRGSEWVSEAGRLALVQTCFLVCVLSPCWQPVREIVQKHCLTYLHQNKQGNYQQIELNRAGDRLENDQYQNQYQYQYLCSDTDASILFDSHHVGAENLGEMFAKQLVAFS